MCTTRAPAARASSCDPSVEPLSATNTSPWIPVRSRKLRPLRTQVATVSASLRHGIRMVSSSGCGSRPTTPESPVGPGSRSGSRLDLRADSIGIGVRHRTGTQLIIICQRRFPGGCDPLGRSCGSDTAIGDGRQHREGHATRDSRGGAQAHRGESATAARAGATDQGAGLRRVPYGPAPARWRAAGNSLSGDSGPRDRRHRRGARPGGQRVPHRRSRGGALARLYLRRVPLLPLPAEGAAAELAPLLCAGLIGYRAYRLACFGETVGEPRRLGLYGFGAAAHLLAQVARAEGHPVFAFTRPGDTAGQRFARELGAEWAGGSDERPGEWLDAAIVFAPVGALVPAALGCVRPGGRVVCAGIHMSDVPAFPYRLLRGERSVSSVANLTRADGREFLALAARLHLKATVQRFALGDANLALERLRSGALEGAAVLELSEA